MNWLLAPLAAGFRLGVAVRREAYRLGWFKTHRLNRPVVSVGNLTTGGTGKTPLVLQIAQLLLGGGWKPSILTRGYGRRGDGEMIVLEPAAERQADPRNVGDEPALLARSLPEVPIVVCANRYHAGILAERRFGVNVHLLDDGFQHWALARDLEIVLLDVTQELSDWALLPAGRQRETTSALERAGIAILTRTELGDPEPMEARVRQVNPDAVIFRAATRLRELIDLRDGGRLPPTTLQGEPVHAFCGIGNPRAFFSDLMKWGLTLTAEDSFRDHHVYDRKDVASMMSRAADSGAKALVTTEKDAMNLPPLENLEVPILACVIKAEIQDAQKFEEFLVSRVKSAKEKN